MRFMLGPSPATHQPAVAGTLPGPEYQPAASSPGQAGSEFTPPAPPPGETTSRRKPAARQGSPFLVVLAVLAVVGTACVVGFFLIRGAGSRDAHPTSVREVADYNFAYDFPGQPWEKDPSPPPGIRANLFSFKRDDGDAHAAFAASKFDNRNPQPGDLRESLFDRLRGVFEDPELTPEKGATWAGQEAVKYTFRGLEKGTTNVCAGEAYAIGYKGIGYWFIAWAPERAVAGFLDEFADLRGRFTLLHHRDDWKETATPAVVFPGDAADYHLIDTERWWKKPSTGTEPRDVDPKADLLLWAEYPVKKKVDVKPKAELVTYVLDPAGDGPIATVRKYLRDRYAKEAELFGETKLSDLSDEPLGDPPAHLEQQGIETVRLKADALMDSNRSKLHVLSAISTGNKVVGVDAHCPWSERSVWERRLIHIAGALRPGRQ